MSSELAEFMYEAVSRGDAENVKALLQKGVRVNTLVQSGYTLLGQAVRIGNLEVLKALLHAEDFYPPDDRDYAADAEEPYALDDTLDAFLRPNDAAWNRSDDKEGTPRKPGPLHDTKVASQQHNPLPCIYLPRDPSSQHRDYPLHMGLGLFQSLRRLAPLRRKTDVNLPDFFDRMPIHYAAQKGKPEVLDLLIKARCVINVSDSENVTPLQLAVTGGHEQVTRMLLEAGSRVNSTNSDRSSTLHIAARRGFASITERLLQYGAEVDAVDSKGHTPLYLAIRERHYEVVKVLINYRANVNIEGYLGQTPLWEAVTMNRDVAMAKLLLDGGAKVLQGKSLLHDAVLMGLPELVQLLVERGFSVNSRDDIGNSPLHIAIQRKNPSILRELVQFGGDVNNSNSLTGTTLLHQAVTFLDESNMDMFRSVLEILLKAGCRMNTESSTAGDTPLFRAIVNNKLLFAEELIREGCDVNRGNVYTCDIDNLGLAKRLRELRLVKMIVYAGYHLDRFAMPVSGGNYVHSGAEANAIRCWLCTVKTNPMGLSELCRIAVRQWLGENLVSKVSKLVLPASMKDFLLLNDVCSELSEQSFRSEFPIHYRGYSGWHVGRR